MRASLSISQSHLLNCLSGLDSQWRYQDGHDRTSPKLSILNSNSPTQSFSLGEVLEKATRVLTEEEKELLEKDFIGRNGEKRKLEVCLSRMDDHAKR